MAAMTSPEFVTGIDGQSTPRNAVKFLAEEFQIDEPVVSVTKKPSVPFLHYDGFIGIEKSTVGLITAWLKNPSP
ncbi:MAG: hypothetical protein ACYC9K_07055 [Sulfuricaulis sp.]